MTMIHSLLPGDWVTLGYWFVIAVMIAVNFGHIPLASWLLFINTLVIVFWTLINLPARVSRNLRLLVKAGFSYLLIPLAFNSLAFSICYINPVDVDSFLSEWDKMMFGISPNLWLENFMHPVLTEVLQIFYVSFFFWPLILGTTFMLKKDYRALEVTWFAVTFGFYLSFLGYIVMPAVGPRFALADLFSKPLEGVMFYETFRLLVSKVEIIKHDCFPSGHTMMMLIITFLAWYFRSRLRWPLILVTLGIMLSTIYLRYHYIADLLAAIVAASLVLLITLRIYPRQHRLVTALPPPA